MELKDISAKLGNFLSKYRYVVLIFIIGLILMYLPSKEKTATDTIEKIDSEPQYTNESENLENLLKAIHGAGNVRVMLSFARGEEIIYQKDSDVSDSDGNSSTRDQTVIITNSDRIENGLIRQVNPPVYLGAIIICEGADDANVRLSITQAVSKITGLSTDHICVLKMK